MDFDSDLMAEINKMIWLARITANGDNYIWIVYMIKGHNLLKISMSLSLIRFMWFFLRSTQTIILVLFACFVIICLTLIFMSKSYFILIPPFFSISYFKRTLICKGKNIGNLNDFNHIGKILQNPLKQMIESYLII